jgi:transcriptional regulator with XRE-family HTH domain
MSETLSLADLLIKFRDILDESQKEVAEQLDIPPPSLSFYENEERLPPFDVLVELLDHYDARLVVETDLGKWTFKNTGEDNLKLNPEEKTDEMGLLAGIDDDEKEDLIAYIRRRRRKNQN